MRLSLSKYNKKAILRKQIMYYIGYLKEKKENPNRSG